MSSPSATAASSPLLNTGANPPNPSRSNLPHGQRHAISQRAAVGSVTQTIESSSSRSTSPGSLVLRLRGAHNASGTSTSRGHRRRITWAEDVIDNEGLGRKSSKVCCIYHKTREFGESSSEDDSSSDSSDNDSDAGASDSPDDGGARMSGNRRGRKSHNGHKHGDDCNHGSGKAKAKRKPSPNAYEKMPKYTTKQEK